MRVLQIISGRALNGAVRYGVAVARLLAQRGHQVTVLLRPELELGPLTSWLDDTEIVRSSLRRTPEEIRRIGALCREKDIELLHTHMSAAHAFGALLRIFYGIPCAATSHALNIQLHWCVNDRVICHNTESLRFQNRRNLVAKRKLRLVPAFIEESFLAIPAEDRLLTRERLGIPPHALVLTTIGNAMRRKGVIDLVEALPQVRQQGHDACLVICGWSHFPGYRAEVDERARALGVSDHLIWLERRPDADIPHLLRATDLYVQASQYDETGPLVVLEAMAIGLPVVGTMCGSMPDFIVPEVTGKLVPTCDPAALGRAIAALLADGDARRRMGEAGHERFEQQFSSHVVFPQIDAILSETAALRRWNQAA